VVRRKRVTSRPNVKLASLKRTFNLGDYESLQIELQSVPDEGQPVETVLDELAARAEDSARRTYGHRIKEKREKRDE